MGYCVLSRRKGVTTVSCQQRHCVTQTTITTSESRSRGRSATCFIISSQKHSAMILKKEKAE